jgi:hypothetical protein
VKTEKFETQSMEIIEDSMIEEENGGKVEEEKESQDGNSNSVLQQFFSSFFFRHSLLRAGWNIRVEDQGIASFVFRIFLRIFISTFKFYIVLSAE